MYFLVQYTELFNSQNIRWIYFPVDILDGSIMIIIFLNYINKYNKK